MALKLDTLVNSGLGGLRWEGAALALSNELLIRGAGAYWKLYMKGLFILMSCEDFCFWVFSRAYIYFCKTKHTYIDIFVIQSPNNRSYDGQSAIMVTGK